MLADNRPINVRPWLYRIARNRCLNHLRRNQAVGVDSMDIHFSEHGASTADKVHEREEFRQLLGDIRDLPETQRTALVLREMDALSYEQIAEAMETTVSSVKSLLVRARVSLTEAAEARLLSCDEVREELAEVAEGLRRKQSPLVRRHVKNCDRCEVFQSHLKNTNHALAALLPIAPTAWLAKLCSPPIWAMGREPPAPVERGRPELRVLPEPQVVEPVRRAQPEPPALLVPRPGPDRARAGWSPPRWRRRQPPGSPPPPW